MTLYLKACFRDNVGSAISFHRKDGRGYSTNINEAHQYTQDEAQEQWDNCCRDFEMLISLDLIMRSAEKRFDMQYLDCDYPRTGDSLYYSPRSYDGNDLIFITPIGSTSNASLAASELWRERPLYDMPSITTGQLEAHSRLAVRQANIDIRSRATYSGLTMPKRVKNERRRSRRGTTGKGRLNCVSCGRLFWDYDPERHECDTCEDLGTPRYR